MIRLKTILEEGHFEVTATGVNEKDTRFSKSGVDRRDKRTGDAGAKFSYKTVVKAASEEAAKQEALKDPRLRRMARQNKVDVKDLNLTVASSGKQGLGEAGNANSGITKYANLAHGKLEEAAMYLQMATKELHPAAHVNITKTLSTVMKTSLKSMKQLEIVSKYLD